MTFAALDCLPALDFEAFLPFGAFLAFFVVLERYMPCFCFATALVVKPKLNASARASARNFMLPMLLCGAGKPQIHL